MPLRPRLAEALRRGRSLEEIVGLHESIEIDYMVDGFQAELLTADGAMSVAKAMGDTISTALEGLLKAAWAVAPSKEKEGGR